MQKIRLLPAKMAILQYGPGVQPDIPYFAQIRTREETSLVVEEAHAPARAATGLLHRSTGWRMFEVLGPFPLDAVGILASIATPLAGAKVSIFALATFNTDYFLIRGLQLKRAVQTLRNAGHTVTETE